MRWFRKGLIVSLLISMSIAGCVSNAGYLMDTYGGHPHEVLEVEGGSFWIWDRPDLGKIMTSPSPGTIVGPAMISGVTFMAVNIDPTIAVHQSIATKYLSNTGRTCSIKKSFEIARPEYEHEYICKKKI